MERKSYKIHSAKQSLRYLENKRRRTVWTIILCVVSVAVWIYVLSAASKASFISIENVQIEADQDLRSLLSAAAMNAMEGNYFGMFSKQNAFIYPKKEIETEVKAKSSRISGVLVEKKDLNTIVVKVTEKKAAALVCLNLPDFSSEESNNCYFADSNGTIYMQAPNLSDGLLPKYFVPDSNLDEKSVIGKAPIDQKTFAGLKSFFDGIMKTGVTPLGLLLKGQGEYELYFANADTEPNSTSSMAQNTAVIYMNERNVLANELSNFTSFWSHMNTAAKIDGVKTNFDYIDLRYGSNVFYR